MVRGTVCFPSAISSIAAAIRLRRLISSISPGFILCLAITKMRCARLRPGRMQRHMWYSIGGAWAANLTDDQLKGIAAKLAGVPLVRIVGDGPTRFNVLHAEFFGSDADLEVAYFPDDVRQQLLWGRSLALGTGKPSLQRGLSPTYCGHTPMKAIKQIGAQIFIDTGAYTDDGRLTIVEAGTERRWSVKQGWAAGVGVLAPVDGGGRS